jgi:hypothetical protein
MRATTKPRRRRRDRFAPVLTALLQDLFGAARRGGHAGDVQVLRLAREELGHLRAVMREAYLQTDAHHVSRPWDRREACLVLGHEYVEAGVEGLLEFKACARCGALPYSRGGSRCSR